MQTRLQVPARRVTGLAITATADEVLIYDTERHHIHHLNATSSAVWRVCDGRHGAEEIARLAGAALGQRVDEVTVRFALTKLDEANLLVEPLPNELRTARLSRRTLIRRAAIAGAIAVPAIASTTAPAFAASQCGNMCQTDTACVGNPIFSNNGCTYCVAGLCTSSQPADSCGRPCTQANQASVCKNSCSVCSGGFCREPNPTCVSSNCKGLDSNCNSGCVCVPTGDGKSYKCQAAPHRCGDPCTNAATDCPKSGCIYCNQGVCSSSNPNQGVVSRSNQSLLKQEAPAQISAPTETPAPTQPPIPTQEPPTPTPEPPTPTPEPPTPSPTQEPPTPAPALQQDVLQNVQVPVQQQPQDQHVKATEPSTEAPTQQPPGAVPTDTTGNGG